MFQHQKEHRQSIYLLCNNVNGAPLHLFKNVALSITLIIVYFCASALLVTSLHLRNYRSLSTSRKTATKYTFSGIANFDFDVNLSLKLRNIGSIAHDTRNTKEKAH